MSAPTATESPNRTNAGLAREGDWPYRFELIDLGETYIDKRYQRPLKPIPTAIDPRRIQVLTVSERPRSGKRFAVVDGQRRRDLLEREGWRGKVPALIYYDLAMEDEAELFALFQRERKGITPYERFKAELAAKHPRALAIESLLRSEGFEMAEQDTTMRHVKAVSAVERIYSTPVLEKDPDEKKPQPVEGSEGVILRRTLQLVKLAWDGVPYSTRDQMIKGVATFVQENDDIDEERFVKRLKNVTPSQLDERASKLRESYGLKGKSPKYVAEAIQIAYRGRR